jgi:acetolactate synthase-1/2/3 large subunit
MASNRPSGAEAMVRMLDGYGVRHLFGLCGDTSLPFYDALYRLEHGISHVLTRDERHAAYMADAYARVTGRPGICEGPSGGGATYILPGLVEANESSIPVLAITTDIATSSRGRFVLTELDQTALFRPLTKWNATIDRAAALPALVRRAFREMTTGRPGAAQLTLPFDVQKAPLDEAEIWADPAHRRFPAARTAPDPTTVAAFVDALLAAERPLAICGGGVVIAGAEAALQRLAERLGLVVATTISGQGAIGDEHPLALGVVGSNGGTPATRAVVDDADLVLFIGCRAGSVTTERWRHPAPDAATILHIDVDPDVPGTCYRTAAALVGDARLALELVEQELDRRRASRPSGPAIARVAAATSSKFEVFAALAGSEETPIRPERLVAALDDVLPDEHVLVADPGTPCPYLAAFHRQRLPGRRFISNRTHGALGYALPAVVGAALGRPTARSVAVMGDGSFAMACGELETIRRLAVPVVLIVVSNASFGWIKAGQRAGFDARYFAVDFERLRHAEIARAFGLDAIEVTHPAALRPALARALALGRPVLVDVLCQPLHEARAPVSEWVA